MDLISYRQQRGSAHSDNFRRRGRGHGSNGKTAGKGGHKARKRSELLDQVLKRWSDAVIQKIAKVSNAETLRQSSESTFPLLRHLRTIPLFQ